MVYFTEKIINGKKYIYAVKSIRLENGKITKISKIVNKKKLSDNLKNFFEEKEKKLFENDSLKKYKTNLIFTKERIKQLAVTKYEFKRIISKLTKNQIKDLFDRFTANFTYESNALEGNSLTLKDVSLVLFENQVINGKDLREIYETRNSRKVVESILKNKFKVSEEDIIKMHKILTKDMEIETGYKKVPNFILHRNVKTTPPEEVRKEMKNLIAWFYSEKNIHPLQKAAFFHGRFEKIHPFDDGNGRVGRFLINIILINEGYAPLIIRKSQRISYLKSLEDFDNGYIENIERFLLEKYKDTFRNFFQIYLKYLK